MIIGHDKERRGRVLVVVERVVQHREVAAVEDALSVVPLEGWLAATPSLGRSRAIRVFPVA